MGIFFLKEPIRQKNKTLLEMLEAREIPLPYLQNHPSIQDMEVCLWLQRKKLQMFPFVICNLSLSKIWLEFRNGLVAFKLRLLLVGYLVFLQARQHRIAAQSHISQQHFGVPLNLTLIRRMKYLLVIIIRLKSSVLLKLKELF